MRYKVLAVAGLASILALGALGQDQTSPNQASPGMMGQGHGMMGRGMTMGTMTQMTTHHQQMTELMNKLMQNMTVIQSEKDPAALKAKIAEHQELLKQMQGLMTQQGGMMKDLSGQIQRSCPMSGSAPPAADKGPVK